MADLCTWVSSTPSVVRASELVVSPGDWHWLLRRVTGQDREASRGELLYCGYVELFPAREAPCGPSSADFHRLSMTKKHPLTTLVGEMAANCRASGQGRRKSGLPGLDLLDEKADLLRHGAVQAFNWETTTGS